MLILEPNICSNWGEDGAYLTIYSLMYMKATTPDIREQAINADKPITLHLCINKDGVRVINSLTPETKILVDAWVKVHNLIDVWKKEQATYLHTIGNIYLPGIKPESVMRVLEYDLHIGTPTGPTSLLRFLVRINKDGANGFLYLPGEHGMEEDNCIAKYKLQYPIIMDSIKAAVANTMQEYVNYLLTP